MSRRIESTSLLFLRIFLVLLVGKDLTTRERCTCPSDKRNYLPMISFLLPKLRRRRKILSDANAWPPTKREESTRVLGRLGDPLGEPVRLELVHVASPNLRVMMDQEHGHLKNYACRVNDASNLHLLVCFPGNRYGRWIQPENLIKDHGHLHIRPA
ncbi:hypothetical protein U9M48_018356 [Paspalum notatum var. saurae]|uniref:Secreted protein n=1 Tax=Paspalum notatum var. saurae TaxID=547442 RepID=A0AAQ3TBM2_PASNO